MSTQYSQQLNQQEQTQDWNPLSVTENRGRVRAVRWNFNTTDDIDAALASGDVVRVAHLRKGDVVMLGRVWFEALGAGQTLDFGLLGADGDGTYDGTNSDDPDFFTTSAIAAASAGESDFGVLQVDNPCYTLLKDCYLTMTIADSTTAAAAAAADKDIDGYVLLVGKDS